MQFVVSENVYFSFLSRMDASQLALQFVSNSFHLSVSPSSSQCTVGSRVAMRVGGEFFFDPSPCEPSVDLLLVAGGVGINPLYSIMLHTADLLRLNRASGGRDYNIGSAHLCYSAKNTEELLFKVCFRKFLCVKSMRRFFFLIILINFYKCTTSYLLCSQNSIIEVCQEFPDKFSCDFHVTQQSTDVDLQLLPFVNRKYCTFAFLCLDEMIE